MKRKKERAYTITCEFIEIMTTLLFVLGDCNIPGNATLVYDINFIDIVYELSSLGYI